MVTKLQHFAELRPDEAALLDERGETSWAEANERTNRLVALLRSSGLEAGDAVAILSGNAREVFEAFCACAHASFVAVPINWHFAEQEVRYVLENSDARALLVDSRFAELGAAAAERLPLALRVVWGTESSAGLTPYEQALASQRSTEPDGQGEGSVMFYTSGTTGRPKGVRRTAGLGAPIEAVSPRSQGFSALLGIPANGVTLVCGPVYHSAQWAFSSFPLEIGSSLVLRHRFDAVETLDLIDRHKVTNVHLVPTQFVRLLRVEESVRVRFDGSTLIQVLHGAAPCAPSVKRQMIDWWGPVISEYYGGTEGGVISVISAREWLERPTSVGRPSPTVEVKILDEDGKICEPGVSGQIYLRSLMATDFEYHKDTEKTAGVYREPGLFTMGDIGQVDEEGYLYLTDRKIDMIISGGVNIYPAEIERVLGDHSAVADVTVFGVPHEEFGEEVKAVVEVAPGVEPGQDLADELVGYCRQHLAGYKAPKSIDFRELPRQATGKLMKRALRDEYWRDADRTI
ncbi:MAG: AMP-binding protein [Acidobacteriota bacterium]